MVIAQTQKLWKVKEENLKHYQQYLEDLTRTFDGIEYTIRRSDQKVNFFTILSYGFWS